MEDGKIIKKIIKKKGSYELSHTIMYINLILIKIYKLQIYIYFLNVLIFFRWTRMFWYWLLIIVEMEGDH